MITLPGPFVALNTLVPRKYNWIWGGRVPVGELTLLSGIQGQGKSTLAAAIVAAVTRGWALPDEDRWIFEPKTPGFAIWLTTEEDPENVITPRLKAAGADMTRVFAVPVDAPGAAKVRTLGNDGANKTLSDTLQALRDLAPDAPILVIADPLRGFMPPEKADKDAREYLQGLLKMIRQYQIGFVGIHHLNKSLGQGDAMYAVSGSNAWTEVPRSVLLAGLVKGAPEGTRPFIVAHSKFNMGREPGAVQFEIEGEEVEFVNPKTGKVEKEEVGALKWVGLSLYNKDDVTAVAPRVEAQTSEAVQTAIDALQFVLADGPMPSNQVKRACLDNQFQVNDASLKRARIALGITDQNGAVYKEGKIWMWSLPENKEDK